MNTDFNPHSSSKEGSVVVRNVIQSTITGDKIYLLSVEATSKAASVIAIAKQRWPDGEVLWDGHDVVVRLKNSNVSINEGEER